MAGGHLPMKVTSTLTQARVIGQGVLAANKGNVIFFSPELRKFREKSEI